MKSGWKPVEISLNFERDKYQYKWKLTYLIHMRFALSFTLCNFYLKKVNAVNSKIIILVSSCWAYDSSLCISLSFFCMFENVCNEMLGKNVKVPGKKIQNGKKNP